MVIMFGRRVLVNVDSLGWLAMVEDEETQINNLNSLAGTENEKTTH